LKPFITFADPVNAYYCDSASQCAEDRPKHDEEYGDEVERIIAELKDAPGLPPVQYWGAWNEPDLSHGADKYDFYDAAPQAAQIWRYAEGALMASGCSGCYMLAGEFSEYNKKYIGEYKSVIVNDQHAPVTIGKASITPGKPIIWGIHDYHDLVHFSEHHENTDARAFIRELDALNPHIWLSELGVELENPALTSLQTGNRNGRKIKHLVRGKLKDETPNELQTEAANDFLTLGTLPHVEMLDYYQYRSHRAGFDSALLNPTGKEPKDWREAYCVLALGHPYGCPASVKAHSTLLSTKAKATIATATAIVDPHGLPTEYWLKYGETTAYGQETAHAELPNETGEQSVTATLSGLKPCTTYHYQVEAENEGNEGEPSLGGEETFTTSGCGLEVTTGSAYNIETDGNSVWELTGLVNPGGTDSTYYFEYGQTTAYGHTTAVGNAGSGDSPIEVRAEAYLPFEFYFDFRPLILICDGHHYRLVGESSGHRIYGEDRETFECV
jgi:hypothetical protein